MASHQFCAVFQTDHLTLSMTLINQYYVPLLENFCRRPGGLNALRGCVTNGFDWKFFVFRVQNDKENKGELLLFDPIISYTDLTLLMGVLYDWVKNCRDANLQFCGVVTCQPTEEMTQKKAQDDVSDTEKLGQQVDKILSKLKGKRRKAKEKQVSTENVNQVDGQSLMVLKSGVLNDDDSERATESHSKIPGSSRKRVRNNVGDADDGLKKKRRKKKEGNLSN